MYTTSQQTISLVVSWDTIGSINTSLTGFTFELYAGSIHLAVLGKLLTSSGFTHWDLGTGFEYKQRLGAVRIEREESLRLLCEVLDKKRRMRIMN